MVTPYNCVVTSSAVYHTPFPITRLAVDTIDESSTVSAVLEPDDTLELPSLVNLNFDSEQILATFDQLLQNEPRVYIPASLYCSSLSTCSFQQLSSVVCEGQRGALHSPYRTASLFYYGDGASHRPRAVLKKCHSCAFYRDGLWCLSQLEKGRQANVLCLHHSDLCGTLALNSRETYSPLGIVSSPISVERISDHTAAIFTSHGVFRSDCRENGVSCIHLARSPVFSGGVCQNGEQILLSLEDDKLIVVDSRKASDILYELKTFFPVFLRSFYRGNVVLAISRRQVGIFHSEKLELLAALESSGTVLDAVSLKEKQNSVRVIFSSADSSLRDCLVEF